MCSVSMVADYGKKLWDPIVNPSIPPFDPNRWPIQFPVITEDQVKKWIELAIAAKEFDKATNQANCEDPTKMEFVDKLVTKLRTMSDEFADLADEMEDVFNHV